MIKALQSIVDYGMSNPAIDPAFGPTAAGDYWSSTSNAAFSSNAWIVSFDLGFVGSATDRKNKGSFSPRAAAASPQPPARRPRAARRDTMLGAKAPG